MDKIYILQQESNVDGEILFNVTPCATLEKAKELMKEEINTLLNESHFKCFHDREDDFILDKTETSFYIEDTCDDYYEDINIYEKEILK